MKGVKADVWFLSQPVASPGKQSQLLMFLICGDGSRQKSDPVTVVHQRLDCSKGSENMQQIPLLSCSLFELGAVGEGEQDKVTL